jgi:hypothetical protein
MRYLRSQVQEEKVDHSETESGKHHLDRSYGLGGNYADNPRQLYREEAEMWDLT